MHDAMLQPQSRPRAELCETIREIAHCCSSTAPALSMHMHLVASMAYMWRSGNKAAEPMLRRVATEGLILVSTGGSDWLAGSGKFEKVDGGWRRGVLPERATRAAVPRRPGCPLSPASGKAPDALHGMEAGFTRFRRATATPFNLIFEARK